MSVASRCGAVVGGGGGSSVRAKSKLPERELRPDRLRRAVASAVVRLAVKGLCSTRARVTELENISCALQPALRTYSAIINIIESRVAYSA